MTTITTPIHDWSQEEVAAHHGGDHHLARIRHNGTETDICTCGDGIAFRMEDGASRMHAWKAAHIAQACREADIVIDSFMPAEDVNTDDHEVRFCTDYRCSGPRVGSFYIEAYDPGDRYCPPSGGVYWICGTCGTSTVCDLFR